MGGKKGGRKSKFGKASDVARSVWPLIYSPRYYRVLKN